MSTEDHTPVKMSADRPKSKSENEHRRSYIAENEHRRSYIAENEHRKSTIEKKQGDN
ncbi:MAG: hypothetical protein IKW95_01505 [Lachnospiraceae bacterium]|nr:hypothetical protein [Lachnospiraceae bacterium]